VRAAALRAAGRKLAGARAAVPACWCARLEAPRNASRITRQGRLTLPVATPLTGRKPAMAAVSAVPQRRSGGSVDTRRPAAAGRLYGCAASRPYEAGPATPRRVRRTCSHARERRSMPKSTSLASADGGVGKRCALCAIKGVCAHRSARLRKSRTGRSGAEARQGATHRHGAGRGGAWNMSVGFIFVTQPNLWHKG
jgi:hypothetical protein